MREIKFTDVWSHILNSLRQMPLRDSMIVVLVNAVAIGFFLVVVRALGPDTQPEGGSLPQTAETAASADDAGSPS
jgi:hypothetical protein